MAATDFIVAIELGSSKITGIAGKKHTDGSIQILALASESPSDCIRKGVIYNLDKTAQCLASIIKKLESSLKASIGKVYVGIGGQSLRTIRNTEVRHLGEETKISQELIDSLLDSNREVPITDYEVLEVAPQEYKVGNNLLPDPVGVPSEHIEGRFLNIIARNSVKQKIDECFAQAGIRIEDYVIAPLALANAVLTSSEKRSGCALIDFGADTTTVSVYKNNILRHLAVIPLGGSNITKDICSQQIEEEDAEELKKRFGQAYTARTEDDCETSTCSIEGKCSIETAQLEDIVEARINEILANVRNQLTLSGYEDRLLAGVILTGGAANLRNMEEAFSIRTKISKIRMAHETHYSLRNAPDSSKDGMMNTLIALLAAGKENCYQPERPKVVTVETEATATMPTTTTEAEARAKAAAEKAAEKAAREKEEKDKRNLILCENFLKQAQQQRKEENYDEALSLIDKARKQIEEVETPEAEAKNRELNQFEKEINKLKKPGWLDKFRKKIAKIGEDILEE